MASRLLSIFPLYILSLKGTLNELVEWAAPRYRSVAKIIERVEEAPMGDYVAVWVTGTLHGERLDGSAFEGIRFVDRFEVRGGAISRQEVWNDLGESL